jgi:NAD(P)-dependent dehydrogenase (short-subunit alcohol dehydrogenase family)
MAQLGLTRGVRIELRAQGTLVIGVHPGWVDTGMTTGVAADKITPAQVVTATLAALAAGEEEVLPDARSVQIRATLRENPKALQDQAQAAWDQAQAAKS